LDNNNGDNTMSELTQLPRVNISLGRKINIGNYESIDVHASFSCDVEPGKTVEDTYERVYKMVKNQVIIRGKQARSDLK